VEPGITASYQASTLGLFAKRVFFKDLEAELLSEGSAYETA